MNLGFRLSGSDMLDKASKPHMASLISLQAWPLSFWGFGAPTFGSRVEGLGFVGFRFSGLG